MSMEQEEKIIFTIQRTEEKSWKYDSTNEELKRRVVEQINQKIHSKRERM